ncbi:UbiA family prenyltransferase [Hymenobacter rigui]|uniref:Ubiquinone biosynthesis protein UbiA n=1 Tax=Hymenobacter rigui TaxID=334424 RepID=A0A428KFG7_9BACT|nr:UbiA family prenyltransferase [Hymenobacter rigui]RSK45173.1 hypothetical protein EI291_18860 [Hymenobacter rigui]
MLATFYASGCVVNAQMWPLLPKLLLLLVGLAVGATYVSAINDWTDRADDFAGGKSNLLSSKSGAFVALLIAGCVCVGLGIGLFLMQASWVSALLYLGSWIAFSCYSWPPIRLKNRGLMGVIADAAGSHFFPQLLVVSVVAAWSGHAVPGIWYGTVGGWALACGLRNILLHQLGDIKADEAAGVNTWVRKKGAYFIQQLGRFGIFPVEVGAFSLLLLLSQQLWPVIFLVLYVALEGFKWRIWGAPAVITPGKRMLLTDYYEVFYPLSFVLALSVQHAVDGWLLGLHLLLFGLRCWQTIRQLIWAGTLIVRKGLSHK